MLGDSIMYATDAYEAMHDADALLILTEWKEFAALDLALVRTALKYPIVFDGRNLYSPDEIAAAGLDYYSIGRAPVETSHQVFGKAYVGKNELEEL
jgi:UDPglucose 6-dehydrogenase